jgi:phosphatidylglycerophosphatase A
MTTSTADHDDTTKATISDVATLIASGAGAGLSPVAPGTAGSIVAAGILAFLLDMPVIWHWCGWVGLIAVAVWSSKRAGAAWGVIDHPAIVIDEFAGLWLAVLIPMTVLTFKLPGMPLLVGSLVLFRLLDIVKPWPVSALERGVPGAWGVVLDDVAAGAMAGGCMTMALMAIAVS